MIGLDCCSMTRQHDHGGYLETGARQYISYSLRWSNILYPFETNIIKKLSKCSSIAVGSSSEFRRQHKLFVIETLRDISLNHIAGQSLFHLMMVIVRFAFQANCWLQHCVRRLNFYLNSMAESCFNHWIAFRLDSRVRQTETINLISARCPPCCTLTSILKHLMDNRHVAQSDKTIRNKPSKYNV